MSLHRAFFWMAGVAVILALVTLWGPMARDRGTPGDSSGGRALAAGSDTTALVLVTTSTNGDLAECG